MPALFGLGMPNMGELLIIAFLVMLLFGGSKLPQLMRNLGRSANEFKKGMSDGTSGEDEHEPVR